MTRTLRIGRGLELPLDAVELSWAAGIFEGEGCVSIAVRNSDETYRLVCVIGSTDREMVEFFHVRWGGWLQPGYGHRGNRKPSWSWTATASWAEKFLNDVRPYLRLPRIQAKVELALQFRTRQSRSAHVYKARGYKAAQREIYHQMRGLNRRGAAASV